MTPVKTLKESQGTLEPITPARGDTRAYYTGQGGGTLEPITPARGGH